MKEREKFCEYFRSGANDNERIGLEIEHFTAQDGHILSYSDGVRDILIKLSEDAIEIFSENDNILGADMGEYTLTLEPGAQLEVSVYPFKEISEIERVLDGFYEKAEPILKKYGAELLNIPAVTEEELDKIELIPKKRYEYMDRYFKTSGTMGRYMMRGSASLQVSVDYKSEADFVKKFRLAYIMCPLFALVTGGKMRDGYQKRIEIWNDVDVKRTRIPEKLFDEDFGFGAYADELLNVPAIFIPDGKEYRYTGDTPIKELIEKYGLSDELLSHYLSMVFPDVRLKKYIEIRIADATSKKQALSYAAIVKAVFYTEMLDVLTERYRGVTIRDIKNAKAELLMHGENANLYGFNAGDELSYIISLAKKYLDKNEFKYISEVDYD